MSHLSKNKRGDLFMIVVVYNYIKYWHQPRNIWINRKLSQYEFLNRLNKEFPRNLGLSYKYCNQVAFFYLPPPQNTASHPSFFPLSGSQKEKEFKNPYTKPCKMKACCSKKDDGSSLVRFVIVIIIAVAVMVALIFIFSPPVIIAVLSLMVALTVICSSPPRKHRCCWSF